MYPGLSGSPHKHFKTCSEDSSKHIHQNDCREKARNHQGRAQHNAEQKKIAAFTMLTGSPLAIRQGMGAKPERSGHKSLHHKDYPANKSGNPANKTELLANNRPAQDHTAAMGEIPKTG